MTDFLDYLKGNMFGVPVRGSVAPNAARGVPPGLRYDPLKGIVPLPETAPAIPPDLGVYPALPEQDGTLPYTPPPVIGGNRFGGQRFGGDTAGGQKFGGNKFGPHIVPGTSSEPKWGPLPPDPPFPNMMPDMNGAPAWGPSQLSLAGAMAGNTAPGGAAAGAAPPPFPKAPGVYGGFADPPPAAPAVPTAQGDAPQSNDQAYNPAPDAGGPGAPRQDKDTYGPGPDPTAPSDTPAGRGLMDRIFGSGDPSTRDRFGLTEADRRGNAFGALGKLGFQIAALGTPQSPDQRAQLLAGMNPGGDLMKGRSEVMGQNAAQQAYEQHQMQLEGQKKAREVMQSPEFEKIFKTMPPQMQALMKATAANGDVKTLAHVVQLMQPKGMSGGVFDPATGTFTDPVTGMSSNITGAGGAPGAGGSAPQGGGVIPQGDSPEPAPTPVYGSPNVQQPQRNEQVLQNSPVGDLVRGVVEGRVGPSALGTRDRTRVMTLAAQYEPGFDMTKWTERNRTASAMGPAGAVGKQVVAMNTLLQHTNQMRVAAGEMDNGKFPAWNSIANKFDYATGGDKASSFNQLKDFATRELDNLVSNNHVTVSETKAIRANLHDANSPQQLQTAIDNIADLAKNRIQSVTRQAQVSLGNRHLATLDAQLDNPAGLKALEDIEANPLKGSRRHEQYAAERKRLNLPDDADVAHYDYQRTPDGRLFKRRKPRQ